MQLSPITLKAISSISLIIGLILVILNSLYGLFPTLLVIHFVLLCAAIPYTLMYWQAYTETDVSRLFSTEDLLKAQVDRNSFFTFALISMTLLVYFVSQLFEMFLFALPFIGLIKLLLACVTLCCMFKLGSIKSKYFSEISK